MANFGDLPNFEVCDSFVDVGELCRDNDVRICITFATRRCNSCNCTTAAEILCFSFPCARFFFLGNCNSPDEKSCSLLPHLVWGKKSSYHLQIQVEEEKINKCSLKVGTLNGKMGELKLSFMQNKLKQNPGVFRAVSFPTNYFTAYLRRKYGYLWQNNLRAHNCFKVLGVKQRVLLKGRQRKNNNGT